MESKPVSTKQKESLVIILIDNVPVSISTKNKTKNEKSSHLFLAILYYLMVFSNGSGNNSTQNKQKL